MISASLRAPRVVLDGRVRASSARICAKVQPSMMVNLLQHHAALGQLPQEAKGRSTGRHAV